MPGTTSASKGIPPLPATFLHTVPPPTLEYQGAEALVYRTSFPTTSPGGLPAYLKHRPSKPYRHPQLDAKLTRHRILAEARVLVKLRREGVSVPAVYALDWEGGWMIGEWITGGTVRSVLNEEVPAWIEELEGRTSDDTSQDNKARSLHDLMARVGAAVGRMHEVGVVHGDLTTSNLMLRPTAEQEGHLSGDVVLIDFGLAAQSSQEEDRAVDLYVLERAFGSTHPGTEGLFQELLNSYGKSYKGAKQVLKRLEDVRLRGRKKIMIG